MFASVVVVIFPFCFTGDDNSSALDEADGECADDREPRPSCGDYVMHFLTLFWKILFAFIPPTGKTHAFYVRNHHWCRQTGDDGDGGGVDG